MDNCFGQHGWREFNRNRKDILSDLDKLLEQTASRPIQVAHGQGVEASIRKWLSEFLPKKYGVTSGYIIPDLYDESANLYHFDIIIYNQLEAPILWTEGNFDQSEQGKYRAIPAKHVVAVYEVKARLTKANITESLKKLNQTEGYTSQLNELFFCGIIFIDLKNSENEKESIIKELFKGTSIYGFDGGTILRFEDDDSSIGRIKVYRTTEQNTIDYQHLKPIAKPIDDLNIFMNEEGNLQISEQGAGIILVSTSQNNFSVSKTYGIGYGEGNIAIHIDWSRSNFSEFCIDLISKLEGLAYNDTKRPNFGRVFDRIDLKKTPIQGSEILSGKPFLKIDLYEGSEFDGKLNITNDCITFGLSIHNLGESTATVSDNSFKNSFKLLPGVTVGKKISLQITQKKTKNSLIDQISKEPLELQYVFVYYSDSVNKDFIAVETKIKISKNKVKIIP